MRIFWELCCFLLTLLLPLFNIFVFRMTENTAYTFWSLWSHMPNYNDIRFTMSSSNDITLLYNKLFEEIYNTIKLKIHFKKRFCNAKMLTLLNKWTYVSFRHSRCGHMCPSDSKRVTYLINNYFMPYSVFSYKHGFRHYICQYLYTRCKLLTNMMPTYLIMSMARYNYFDSNRKNLNFEPINGPLLYRYVRMAAIFNWWS